MFAKAILLLAVLVAGSTPALAQLPLPLPFPPFPLPQGTPEERAACAPDVHRFCENALPGHVPGAAMPAGQSEPDQPSLPRGPGTPRAMTDTNAGTARPHRRDGAMTRSCHSWTARLFDRESETR
jgi:hypothetical protein